MQNSDICQTTTSLPHPLNTSPSPRASLFCSQTYHNTLSVLEMNKKSEGQGMQHRDYLQCNKRLLCVTAWIRSRSQAIASNLCFILDLWCSSHCQRPSAVIIPLCVCLFQTFLVDVLYMLTTLEIVMSFSQSVPWITELPRPALCPDLPPTPSLNHKASDRTALQTFAEPYTERVAISCPHTLNLSWPQAPQTRNNYLQTHAWVFKHAPSSCGHGIWQIPPKPQIISPGKKAHFFFLSKLFTLASLLSLNKYLRETQSQWGKSLKCQPCEKCRSRDLLQEVHFRDRPSGGKPCFIHEDSWATDESRVNDDHNNSRCANSSHGQQGTFRHVFLSHSVMQNASSWHLDPRSYHYGSVTVLASNHRWNNILCEYNKGLSAWRT